MSQFMRKVPKTDILVSELIELIRIERDAGTTRVFRVCSEREIGYLHFRGGRIIHATVDSMKDVSGLKALRVIIAWPDASFDPSDIEVASQETITPGQFAELFGDEEPTMSREQSDNLIIINQPGSSSGMLPSSSMPLPPPSSHDNDASQGWSVTFDDCETAVLLSPEGHLLASKGAADDLTDLAAYVNRLCQLIADALGMEEMVAAECASDGDAFLIYEAADGKTVAVKGKEKSPIFTVLKSRLDL